MIKLNKAFFQGATATAVGVAMFFVVINTAKSFEPTRALASKIY